MPRRGEVSKKARQQASPPQGGVSDWAASARYDRSHAPRAIAPAAVRQRGQPLRRDTVRGRPRAVDAPSKLAGGATAIDANPFRSRPVQRIYAADAAARAGRTSGMSLDNLAQD